MNDSTKGILKPAYDRLTEKIGEYERLKLYYQNRLQMVRSLHPIQDVGTLENHQEWIQSIENIIENYENRIRILKENKILISLA